MKLVLLKTHLSHRKKYDLLKGAMFFTAVNIIKISNMESRMSFLEYILAKYCLDYYKQFVIGKESNSFHCFNGLVRYVQGAIALDHMSRQVFYSF